MSIDIARTIVNVVNTAVRSENLTVEDIQKLAGLNRNALSYYLTAMEKLSIGNIEETARRFYAGTSKDPQGFIKVYREYVKDLEGKAKGLEQATPFSALTQAIRTMVGILTEIEKNAEDILEEPYISISNTRISTLAIIGMLRQSDLLAEWSTILFGAITNILAVNTRTSAPYRIKYFAAKYEQVATTVNDLCNKEKRYSFLKDVEHLRKQQNDMLLYANGTVFTKLLPWNKVPNIAGFKGFAIPSLNVIAFIADQIDRLQYWKYMKDKELKEWMEARIRFLQLCLMDTDPADPEYMRLQQIIEAYDDKLAKRNKKIEEYEKAVDA